RVIMRAFWSALTAPLTTMSADTQVRGKLMFPVQYIEPVFRPPSEAHSFILQVTNGCSWNQCTFCEMYTQPQKKFRARKDEDIRQDLERMRQAYPGVRRVLPAYGDAMVSTVRRLKELLGLIRETFPALERVS